MTSSLKTILTTLETSKSINERKRCMDQLRELMNDRRLIQKLNHHSERQKCDGEEDWNVVFASVHSSLLQEADRYRTEVQKASQSAAVRTKRDNVKNEYSALVVTIASKANQGVPRLKCKLLMKCMLEILNNKFLKKNFADQYVEILWSKVMPFRKYWCEISSEYWSELLKTFVNLFTAPPACVSLCSIVRVLNCIALHGTNQSHLALLLRKRFPLFAESFNDSEFLNKDIFYCDALLRLSKTLCLQLARENRMATCEFGENILVRVIRLYNKLSAERSLVFEFLLLQVHLHHPQGVSEGEGGAYAYNWERWRHQLGSLYSVVETEIAQLYKIQFGDGEMAFSPTFLEFAVEVCKQVFENSSNVLDVTMLLADPDSTPGPASKRRRMVAGVQAVMDSLRTLTNPQEVWPWLSLLGALMYKYPRSVKEVDFVPLLQLMAQMLSTCKEALIMDYLCQCCVALLKVERNLVANTLDEKVINPLWEKIWETTMRTVGLNHNEKESHRLLQALVVFNKAPRLVELVHMFVSGAIKLSLHSLRTLDTLNNYCGLPDTVRVNHGVQPVKPALLAWLLPSRNEQNTHTALSPVLVAKTLVEMTLKTSLKSSKISLLPTFDEPYNAMGSALSSIEQDYMVSSFESGLVLLDMNKTSKLPTGEAVLVDTALRDSLLEMLLPNIEVLEEWKRQQEISKVISEFIPHCARVMNVWSQMLQFEMCHPNLSLRFEQSVRFLVEAVSPCVCGVLRQRGGGANLPVAYSLLVDLRQLYRVELHPVVMHFLQEVTPVELLNAIFVVAITKSAVTADDEDVLLDNLDVGPKAVKTANGASPLMSTENFTEKQNIQLEAIELLTQYCCNSGVQKSDTVQRLWRKLLQFCLPNNLDLDSVFDFHVAVSVVRLSLGVKVWVLEEPLVTCVLNVIQGMCQKMHSDSEAMAVILGLIQGLVVHVHSVSLDLDKENTLKLVKGVLTCVNKGIYCPEVSAKFIRCLSEFAKVDAAASWAVWNCGSRLSLSTDSIPDGPTPVAEEALIFLKSPFYEVRMTAVESISVLFSPTTHVLNRQTKLFEVLHQTVMFSFTVEGELTEQERIDESANRTSSALHALAALLAVSPLFRKRGLFAMFQLVKEKNLNLELVHKVLVLVGDSLKLQSIDLFLATNLHYLVMHWHQQNYKLQEFPWRLLSCKSEVAFYKKYQQIIVPILLQKEDEQTLGDVSQKTGLSLVQLLEACYPRVIACLIPFFSVDVDDLAFGISKLEVHIAKHLHKRMMVSLLTEEHIKELLSVHLAEVVVELMHLLHDSEHFQQLCGCHQPLHDPDPPAFRHIVVLKSLQYLQNNSPSPDTPLVVYLCQCQPNHIQSILLHLVVDIHTAPTLENRLKSFYCYAAFTHILGCELSKGSLGGMASYVVRDVLHSLIRLVKQYQSEEDAPLALAACHFLRTFCEQCLPSCAAIMAKFLVVIVSTLVPLTNPNNDMGLEALSLLRFLIVDNSERLSGAIRLLDPFPNVSVFEDVRMVYRQIKYDEMQYDLEGEIRHFLNLGNANLGCRTEGLQHLWTQLSRRKDELKLMYKELEDMRGFSEDCASSVLHQLICVLVELASIPDARLSLEAARCLGELGPADLTTIVLRPESKCGLPEGNATSRDVLQMLTTHVVGLLAEYLVDEDMDVVQAASHALYRVMGTKEGQATVESKQFISSVATGALSRDYLTPFLSAKKSKKNSSTEVNENSFRQNVDRPNLWCPMSESTHAVWITELVCAILETFSADLCYLPHLVPVCRAKVAFSESLLPLVVQLVLCSSSESCCAIVCQHMCQFFSQHFVAHAELNQERSTSPAISLKHCDEKVYLNRASVQCMLDIVHFIRLKTGTQIPTAKKSSPSESLLLNYLHVAQAAQFCSAYFTSILYTELWCEVQIRERDATDDAFSHNMSALEYICEKEPQDSIVVQNILWEAYLKIGDSDAVYGCGSSHLLDPRTRTRHYELLGKWDKVMLTYDAELASGNLDATRGILAAMQRFGLHHVLGGYITSYMDTSTDLEDFRYECAWRLAQWNIPISSMSTTERIGGNNIELKKVISESEFERYRYLCLKSMNDGDVATLEEAVARARKCVIESLAHASLESSKNIYKALGQLQGIQEIEDFAHAFKQNGLASLEDVVQKWKRQDDIGFNEFEYVELILWQRTVMLDITRKRDLDKKDKVMDVLATLRLDMAAVARKEGYHQVAARCLEVLAQTAPLTTHIANRLRLEESRLSWERGDREVGRYLLRSLITSLSAAVIAENNQDLILYSSSLKLYGDWMVETKSENSQVIINEYFMKALRVMNNVKTTAGENEGLLDIYSSLARFSDAEYQQLARYFKSSAFKIKEEWIAKMLQDADKLMKQSNITLEDRRAIKLNKSQSEIDMAELQNKEKEKNIYLINAMKYYLWGLQHGDKNNLQVFRVVSLWLENTTHDQLNAILEQHLARIPSYKFLPVLPQLTPRISNAEDPFSTKLNALLERCASDHPHHSLPLILALANMYKDREHTTVISSALKRKPPEPRVIGAQQMVQELLKRPVIGPLVKQMEQVASALIRLAYLEVKRNSTADCHTIPKDQLLPKLKNLDSVLVPTLTLQVKKNGRYDQLIGIQEFEGTFSLVGGVNAPKKIHCVGTDGIRRPQLVKGMDDLRQDAVMQQVFSMMNTFLQNNKDTSKRKLLIRTYKVVPLSQRSGLIEWCQNTEPLGSYLTGQNHKSGAHKKYFPQDLTSHDCREKMRVVASKSNEEKLEVYNKICKSIHPVLHNFFHENFPTPGVWFERRLAYIHSVATSSMIGYILGLGDRHLINILIDKKTAEVIHIDFGIAFEMGHILPTPETVPFRLSRDIVDGMGVSGIEGVFRRSCEKTLAVLRQNQETILTILEVLLYDPLYAWTITPTQAYNLQRNKNAEKMIFEDEAPSAEVNRMAERALVRLQQKLQGTEEGTAMSVVGQVSHLLQQATDPGNLSRLYHGWAPYL